MRTNIKRIVLSGALLLGYLYLMGRALTHLADFPGFKDFLPYYAGIGIVLVIVIVTSVHMEVKK